MNPNAPEFKPFKDLIDLDDSESVSSNSTARGNTSLVMSLRAKLSPDISGISDENLGIIKLLNQRLQRYLFKLRKQWKKIYFMV